MRAQSRKGYFPLHGMRSPGSETVQQDCCLGDGAEPAETDTSAAVGSSTGLDLSVSVCSSGSWSAETDTGAVARSSTGLDLKVSVCSDPRPAECSGQAPWSACTDQRALSSQPSPPLTLKPMAPGSGASAETSVPLTTTTTKSHRGKKKGKKRKRKKGPQTVLEPEPVATRTESLVPR